MRHDNARMMSDPAFRKMVKKSGRKGRKSEEDQKTVPTASETVEVLFKEDEDGIYAMVEGRRARVSSFSINSVSEGQSWKCMIDRKERFRPELIPTELVSEKMKEKPVSIVCPVHAIDEQPTSTEPVRIDDAKHLEEIRKLKARNAELRRELGIAEGYKGLCKEKDAEIRNLDRKVKSLSNQVNILNAKTSQKHASELESRIEDLEDGIESRDREIEMLREKLRQLGADDLKAVPHLPPVMRAIKNGSTLIFRDSVEDGRYSVYVNPRGHRLLIVPDANGAVCCDKGEMRLPCIDVPLIGGETGTRKVAIVAAGEGYEVSLE